MKGLLLMVGVYLLLVLVFPNKKTETIKIHKGVKNESISN